MVGAARTYYRQSNPNIKPVMKSAGLNEFFHVSDKTQIYAQGSSYANGNVQLFTMDYSDNDNMTLYTNEYKPNGKSSTKNGDFTTIYDTGIDKTTGKPFYLKAEDKNGNGIIDDGELTSYTPVTLPSDWPLGY